MLKTGWAKPQESDEIVDFIDYVFSKDDCPHDFQTLLPKLYGKSGNGAEHHFVIRENGKIVSTVLAYPVPVQIADTSIMTVGVGSVSVHPRARGKGYMKLLMDAVDERAKELDAVFAALGGDRQRYAYFGYRYGGYQMRADLLTQNMKHVLGKIEDGMFALRALTQADVKDAKALMERQMCYALRSEAAFIEVLRSWNNVPFVIEKNGGFAGYGTLRKNAESVNVAELTLCDEADYPAAIRLLSRTHGELTLQAAPWQKERAKWLAGCCEGFEILSSGAYKIYQPERLKGALARLGGGNEGFEFDGFALPQPLHMLPPDCV